METLMPNDSAADLLLNEGMAKLNITYNPGAGQDAQQGELPDMVSYDASDADIKRMATEAVAGGVPGIDADPDADLTGYVVDRFPAREDMPVPRISVREKTPFGS